MEPVNAVVTHEETPKAQDQRYVIEVKTDTDKYLFSCPAQATYQEAFNAALQVMLHIYDLSKAAEVKNDN